MTLTNVSPVHRTLPPDRSTGTSLRPTLDTHPFRDREPWTPPTGEDEKRRGGRGPTTRERLGTPRHVTGSVVSRPGRTPTSPVRKGRGLITPVLPVATTTLTVVEAPTPGEEEKTQDRENEDSRRDSRQRLEPKTHLRETARPRDPERTPVEKLVTRK